jgi:hypothetical protein
MRLLVAGAPPFGSQSARFFPLELWERDGLPRGKTAFLQQSAHVIISAQIASFKRVEELFRSSQIITNRPIFYRSGVTERVTQISAQFSLVGLELSSAFTLSP